MVDALEGGNACYTTAAPCSWHGDEIEDLLDAGMEQCHGTHEAGFVCDEKGQSRQEVLRAILGHLVLCRLDRWSLLSLLGTIVRYLANDGECGMTKGVFGGCTRIVREKRARELSVVLIGYRDVCDDGQLEEGTLSVMLVNMCVCGFD